MPTYKKTVQLEAIQWTGTFESYQEIERMVLKDHHHYTIGRYGSVLELPTTQGTIVVPKNHYVVKRPDGGFSAMEPCAFESEYKKVSLF